MKNTKLLLVISVSLGISACATLNESECVSADWRIIGLEDGSKGRPVTYIGQHRKACAEHGVTPDLNRYQSGHESGLTRFCTAEVGFAQGKRGYGYNGVCPGELRADFLYGYETGRDLYLINKEINQVRNQVKKMLSEIEGIDSEINALEIGLISKSASSAERLAMLQELKELQTIHSTLESDIRDLELDSARLEGEYDVLNNQHSF